MSGLELFLRTARESRDLEARERIWQDLSDILRSFVRACMSKRCLATEGSIDLAHCVVNSLIGALKDGQIHFDGEEQLKTYLLQAVRHKLVDQNGRRLTEGCSGGVSETPFNTNDDVAWIGSIIRTPSELARIRESRERSLECLQDDEREIWQLYCEMRGFPEIGHRLGITAEGARIRVSCIRRKFGERLDLGKE